MNDHPLHGHSGMATTGASSNVSYGLSSARQMVLDFEDGTLPKAQWTHQAHCIVALKYCADLPLAIAMDKIRTNIKSYNISVGGQNTGTSGYHETITLFYMSTIAHYLLLNGITQLTETKFDLFLRQPFLDKEYPLQFFTPEYLMGTKARMQWQPPDKPSIVP